MNFIQCLQIPCLNWPWECFCSIPVVLVHSHFCQCCGCTELASSFATQNDSWYVTFHLKNWWFDGKWVHRNSYRGSIVSSRWRMILLSKPLASICLQWKGVKCCGGCCNFACCPYFSIDVLQCTETNNTKYFLRSSWVSFYRSKIFLESHPTYMIDSFHTKNNLSWKKRKKFTLCPEIEYGIWSKEDTLFKLALNYDIIHIICIYVRDAGCMGNKIACYVKKGSLFFVDTTITSF